MTLVKRFSLGLILSILLAACGGGGASTPTASSAKTITPYSLGGITGTINETNKTIAVTVPFGTNVTALIATFTTTGTSVAVSATAQVSGTTPNDFTNPVTYTVTAADASTVNYTVTVTVVWVGASGTLSGSIWHAPAVDPDPTHIYAYGGVNYAPNGDLYLLYNDSNNQLNAIIRRNGGSQWTTASAFALGQRMANVYFSAAGVPWVTTEDGSLAYIYTSANYGNATVNWTTNINFSASDGNVQGAGAYDNAFITMNGTDLNLYYTDASWNTVTGGNQFTVFSVKQSTGTWGMGAVLPSGRSTTVYTSNYPHGMTGAFQDTAGNVLVLFSGAFRSTDYGQNFTQMMNTYVDQNDLNGVIAASQNTTDNSIIIANTYYPGVSYGVYAMRVWGTKDYGATYASLVDIPLSSAPFHGAIVTIKNLVVLAVTTKNGSGLESNLSVMTSYDGGSTWSALTQIVDATSGGVNSNYTFGSLKLTANPNTGAAVLMYSLVNGAVRHGIYLKEFY